MPEEVIVTDYNFEDIEIERTAIEETGAEFREINASNPEDVIDRAAGATALINQYVPITKDIFEALSNLKVVARYGIGTDGIDKDAATRHGVKVTNVPDYCVKEVSVHTFALILSSIRQISNFDEHVKDGGWNWRVGKPMSRLAGKKLGIVGFGKIGQEVAKKAAGFDLDVLAYDKYVDVDTVDGVDVEGVKFEKLLKRSDIITVHTPLTNETRGLFDKRAFDQVNDDAIFVNASRGGVVNEDALYDSLKNGTLHGAGLDVLENEPPSNSRLLELDNLVLTPHTAWYSEQSIQDLQRTTAEEVMRVLDGRIPQNLVNERVLD